MHHDVKSFCHVQCVQEVPADTAVSVNVTIKQKTKETENIGLVKFGLKFTARI